MRIGEEYDNHGLSDEEIRAKNERDEPAQTGLSEGERIKIVEKDVASIILEIIGGYNNGLV